MIESLPYSKQIFDLYLKGIYNFETIVFSIGTLTSNSFQSSVVQASVLQNFNDRLLVPAREGKLCKLGGKIFLHFVEKLLTVIVAAVWHLMLDWMTSLCCRGWA